MNRKWSKYLKPREEQVATEHDRSHAKKLAVLFQGKYGFPKVDELPEIAGKEIK